MQPNQQPVQSVQSTQPAQNTPQPPVPAPTVVPTEPQPLPAQQTMMADNNLSALDATPTAQPKSTPTTTPAQQSTAPAPATSKSNQVLDAKPARDLSKLNSGRIAPQKDDRTKNSVQNSLLISEIRDNMIIMSDGSFRAVVVCQSINYDLMSEEERAGIEYSYQNFLNSLYFPIQISIGSRRIDLSSYIENLEEIRRNQDNMLLGHLTDDYLDFIFDVSQRANIMAKNFLVVIPYTLGGDADSSVTSMKTLRANLFDDQKPTRIRISAANYAKAKEEITNRINVVLGGLTSIGIQAGQLPTKALAELYYNFYNPDTAINQPLNDFNDFTGNLYTKRADLAPSNQNNQGGQS